MNKFKFIRIDHVQICVPYDSEEKAREFYLETLGFNEMSKPESLSKNGGFWCRAGEIEVHIGLEDMQLIRSKRHPAFEIANIETARNLLHEAGVIMNEEPPISGRDRFSFADPFGNRIEFLQYK
ncbi:MULTISPECIES: VOC family protein [Bacillaceae]|uniref:VOC family protein n=1 Tax=Metabacillus sediminis TaxID=3117746 RepID=A0ABZ2NKU1_9BACI|nr:VOC family protein [Bacillus sp. SJS]KZZ85276.1 glyoxalase [Bacillus sp. SJS]